VRGSAKYFAFNLVIIRIEWDKPRSRVRTLFCAAHFRSLWWRHELDSKLHEGTTCTVV